METNHCLTYQAFIFRVRRHPERAFYQCTDVGFFESLAERREGGHNQTELLLPGGLSPSAAADLYHTLFTCQVGTACHCDLIKIRILIKINTMQFSILDFISTFKIIVYNWKIYHTIIEGFFRTINFPRCELHQDISKNTQVSRFFLQILSNIKGKEEK